MHSANRQTISQLFSHTLNVLDFRKNSPQIPGGIGHSHTEVYLSTHARVKANINIVNCSTATRYEALVISQLSPTKPLIVITDQLDHEFDRRINAYVKDDAQNKPAIYVIHISHSSNTTYSNPKFQKILHFNLFYLNDIISKLVPDLFKKEIAAEKKNIILDELDNLSPQPGCFDCLLSSDDMERNALSQLKSTIETAENVSLADVVSQWKNKPAANEASETTTKFLKTNGQLIREPRFFLKRLFTSETNTDIDRGINELVARHNAVSF